MRIYEVGVLGHDNPLLLCGDPYNLGISGSVRVRKIERMDRIVSGFSKANCESAWKLRVYNKLHAANTSTRFTLARRAA